MYRYLFSMLVLVGGTFLLSSCYDRMALAESSFGKSDNPSAKASPFSVISMGRDDDDGKAKKWHIGGRSKD